MLCALEPPRTLKTTSVCCLTELQGSVQNKGSGVRIGAQVQVLACWAYRPRCSAMPCEPWSTLNTSKTLRGRQCSCSNSRAPAQKPLWLLWPAVFSPLTGAKYACLQVDGACLLAVLHSLPSIACSSVDGGLCLLFAHVNAPSAKAHAYQ